MSIRRFAAVFLGCAGALLAADDLDSQMKSVIDAYAALEQNAADPVSSEQAFYQGAIPGLLRKLDPHSIFFDPGQFQQLQKLETSTQKGFGTVVSIVPGRVIVLQTLPGTPSAKAGLTPGDEILGINGYQISRLDSDQLMELLGQARQMPAALDVRRAGTSRVMRFTLIPEEMQQPSVERSFFVAAGIGYIKVGSFEESTAKLIQEAIEKLGGENLNGLVLDLRGNPGGLLTAAVETASLFLPPGAPIVTVRGRNVPEHTEKVPATAKPYRFKLAILLNEKTASASEIVSGAMQDHDRATILGVPSYGKGLVQSVFPLSESTGLALTTALYYTPSGRSIQKPLDAARFELAATTAHPNGVKQFHTDKGRIVTGGGGIQPDIVVYPPAMNRLRAALEGSASFPNYATEYLSQHKVTDDFEVTPELLDQFKAYLSDRAIQPGVAEWSAEREYVENRLKTEILNQALGVDKGDQVEAQRDPVILRALETLGR
ncbi:MAG: PDZ domain-containing protein [Acidobacteriia bacterium]|nr:PDZ domain-containing protein [Terriglobia bacterium]